MSTFGDIYSHYYDLLYEDKDYCAEVDYVDGLIKEYYPTAKSLLDLGCGTGRHAELFCDMGYSVDGVDLSEDMLKQAKTRTADKEGTLRFSQADITRLSIDRKFDAIVSLFHVISYLSSNDDLIRTFEGVSDHLKSGGIFIFDFWYGPGVLSDRPAIRVKRLEDDGFRVTRIAEPVMHCRRNMVDVNYQILIKNKKTSILTEMNELHQMRYFFDTELEMVCEKMQLKIIAKLEWMKDNKPDFNTWNALWIVQK